MVKKINIHKKNVFNITNISNIKKNNKEIVRCRYCSSISCIKHGKTSTNKNRYLYKNCNRNFSLNDNRIKHPIEHIFLALLILLNKNISKRNIQKTLEELFKIKLSYSVLDRWFKTFEYLLDNNKYKDVDVDIDKNNINKNINNRERDNRDKDKYKDNNNNNNNNITKEKKKIDIY